MSGPNRLSDVVDNLVYEPTQVHERGVDLTVSAIYRVTRPGRLDFGGDELEDAELEPVPTEPRDPDDAYEWWDLRGGQYVVQYNEFLAGGAQSPLFLQPRNELLARGATHPSLRVSEHLPLLPLSVPDGGIRIKENARVSTLVPTEPGGE
ncbi:dCTP deaminase [Halovivax sp.]|uniref:dCTP deaminase n=1 Tax=Halovivax sp. TaxID=1935978 RepID=UPI0025C15349|nr:dCTP deaminase [Halovivax sp.]